MAHIRRWTRRELEDEIDNGDIILSPGDTVEVLGYLTENDGGGANYIVKPGTPRLEFGDICAKNSNACVIQLLPTEVSSIKEMGAAAEDAVNHPAHYQSDHGIECWEAIRAALGDKGFVNYCRGNAIKYAWRDKVNNAEDFRKAAWYLNKAADVEEGKC